VFLGQVGRTAQGRGSDASPPGRRSSSCEVHTTEQVNAETGRLTAAGLIADEEMGTTCCYAAQENARLTGPSGERWEV